MIDLDTLLAPIPGDHPGGEDMSFSSEFDTIRQCRKSDDTGLSQGAWETNVKTAQWPKVKDLCENILTQKSKDLQVACWYTEALTKLHGLPGTTRGFVLLRSLVTDFWEFMYPELDPSDPDSLDERIGKLEWLNKELSKALGALPVTSKSAGGYTFLQWQESRQVENLGLKDSAAKEQAIAEGKLSGEAFDKAVTLSGLSYYQLLQSDLVKARDALKALDEGLVKSFEDAAPSVSELTRVLDALEQMVDRILRSFGYVGGQESNAKPAESPAPVHPVASVASIPNSPSHSIQQTIMSGPISSRAQAIQQLREVAQYFKRHEPHSPVAYLAERAAAWGEMPLDQWLASVIKDDGTLYQLRELLGVKPTE